MLIVRIFVRHKRNINMKATQILHASILGTQAYKDGKKKAPFFNTELLKMLEGREIGKTPKGEASSIEIMKAYTNAWDLANLADDSWKENFGSIDFRFKTFSQNL